MASDNTMGAPTEGLGQTVTFAFNAPNTPGATSGGYGQLRVGMQGGTVNPGGTGIQNIEPKQHPLVAKLLGMTDKIASQELKRRQQDAYVSGMQRVASGEAVADIAKDQPWYSTLFGNSDVVEGARAYASQAAVSSASADLEELMPTLAALPPEEAKAHFSKVMNDNMTGDTATDANLVLAFGKTLPGIMKRQAKEHYGYLQNQAVVEQGKAFRAVARETQAAAKGFAMGSYTEDDYNDVLNRMEAALLPAPGQDIEKYKHGLTALLEEQALAGNMHMLNALHKTNGEPSIFDALNPDQKNRVDSAMQRGENNLRQRYSYEWSSNLAEIETKAATMQPGETAQLTSDRIDALNAQYTKETGSRVGLIMPERKAALVSGSAKEIIREKQRQIEELARREDRRQAHQDRLDEHAERQADKATADAEKAADALKLNNAMREYFKTGDAGLLANSVGVDRKRVDSEIYKDWSALGGQPGGMMTPPQIELLSRNMKTNYTNTNVQDILQGQIKRHANSTEITPAFQSAVANYQMLHAASPSAANAYYGDYAAKLDGYIQDTDAHLPPEQAFKNNFLARKRPPPITQKDRDAAASAAGEGWIKSTMNTLGLGDSPPLAPGQAGILARELNSAVDSHVANGKDVSEATSLALNSFTANGKGEIIGGFVITKDPGQKTVASFLTSSVGPDKTSPVGTDTVNNIFRDAVREKIVGDGKEAFRISDMTSVHIMRHADSNGKMMFIIRADKDGKPYQTVLTSDEIYAKYEEHKRRMAQAPLARVGQFGLQKQIPANQNPNSWLYTPTK
jgi:hypothetical protein